MSTPTKHEIASWFGYDDDEQELIRVELDDAEVVFACYETGDYSGSWTVIFIRDGKWFEVTGSHCSCNGPEWDEPALTTPEELLKYHAGDWGDTAAIREHLSRNGAQ